jgi:glycerol-1-phosphate dehydrogenase [NAD(P)+]
MTRGEKLVIFIDSAKDSKRSKSMELPRFIVIGHEIIDDIGDICKKLLLSGKALIISDENTKKIAGDRIENLLSKKPFEVEQYVIKDATMAEVKKVKKLIKNKHISFALGVGGGRPIDVAKCASFYSEIPFISIPTAASHDGIVSSQASIMNKNRKESITAQTPIAVIGDAKIIAMSPYRLLAAGCGDIISNYSAVRDWVLAKKLKNEYFSNYAAALSEMTAQILVENSNMIRPNFEESARMVIKALVSSGVAMSIAGSSRPASGSEHMFSHALDRLAPKPALHGEQCAVGCIMMMYLHGGDWQSIKTALERIGVPTTAFGLGIDESIIVEALTTAHTIRSDRYTILGDGLTRDAAEDLAVKTGVITS